MADLRANLEIPKNTALFDDKGLMTLEWQKYLKELQKAVTGALEALETEYLNFSHAGDVRGASVLSTANAVPLVGIPGVLLQGPVGETGVVITYLTGTPGAGQSSKTVTFTNGIETAHT
jgi:hypothetical protein